MAESMRHAVSRPKLREKIISAAIDLFEKNGVKSVTMDNIASSLGISKRTLYEVFADKETLLVECVRHGQEETDEYMRQVRDNSDNVLEVLLKGYQRSIERFHATNKSFFEDIKRYPRAYSLIKNGNNRSANDTINFFRPGVEQGYFRDDVNFAIVGLLVREQLDLLMDSELCRQYSFLEVYESIMFISLRGISTEKGVVLLDDFIREYRQKQASLLPRIHERKE